MIHLVTQLYCGLLLLRGPNYCRQCRDLDYT